MQAARHFIDAIDFRVRESICTFIDLWKSSGRNFVEIEIPLLRLRFDCKLYL